MAEISIPVLIIAFNRPKMLKKLLDSLEGYKIKKVYAFVDHAREDHPGEYAKVEQCRNLLNNASFGGDKVILSPGGKNLGCGLGPFTAISQAFREEEQLIILEDDCIPAPSFFPFCEELLTCYKSEKGVWMVSGNNFSESRYQMENSYTFSGYAHFWGWATWRDRWSAVEFDTAKCLKRIDDLPESRFLSLREREFFESEFRSNFTKPGSDVWDYQAALAMALSGALSIVPRKNLVSNIGSEGTHFVSAKKFHNLPTDSDFFINSHPEKVERDDHYDRIHFEKHWLVTNRRSFTERMAGKWRKYVKRIIKK